MLAAVLRWLYSLSLYVSVPFVLLRLWRLGSVHQGYRERIAERFGFVASRSDAAPLLWLHAVSVGEVQAAAPLVQSLRARYPAHAILVTTTTPTGAAHAHRQFGDTVKHAYFPYDLPDVVARFLDRIRPALLLLMERELWPNLLGACRIRQVPVVLANARLSARSARHYRWLGPLIRTTLRDLTAVAAQSRADGERFVALGLPEERLHVIGSMKFDVSLPSDISAQISERRRCIGDSRPVWIAASTHPGEEETVLAAHAMILRELPACLLLLAPRHPARNTLVAAIVEQRGLRWVLRSCSDGCDSATQVFLVDTLGELVPFYGLAHVAFVGGSLVPIGGHNLLEPAEIGVPVITGPHLANFAEIGRLLGEAGAATIVSGADALAREVLTILRDETVRTRRAEAGKAVVRTHAGATARLVQLLEQILGA